MSIHRHKYPDPAATAKACALHILDLLEQKLSGEGEATLAVSGGSTPKLMFGEMARQRFEWERVHLFFVDERCVPPTDEQSNYRMVEQAFINPAHFPRRNVHRIHGELRPELAAERYADDIRGYFGSDSLPHFDVIHCGVGPDCHTASLFPGEPLIDDRDNLTAAVHVEKLNSWRVTLLPGVLLNARHTAMLVCGADKAQAVHQVFQEPFDPLRFPAQLVTHDARGVSWFLDEPAAALMDS